MRTLIILYVISLIGILPAQNWTPVKETNINVATKPSVDIFTNRYGNHIIVQEDNSLKYYRMDVLGSTETFTSLETSSVVSPSISGDEDNIYVVYRKNDENFIRTKYSSDGGASWSFILTLNYNASSMESVFSKKKLHLAYEVSNVVYYSYYNTENPGWSAPFTVSSNEQGFSPRISSLTSSLYAGSIDRIYIMYFQINVGGRWRQYDVENNIWGSIYEGFNFSDSNPLGFAVDGQSFIHFYFSVPNEFYSYDLHRTTSVTSIL